MLTNVRRSLNPAMIRWTRQQEYNLQRMELQFAIQMAFDKFQVSHPFWVNSLFDLHFLTHEGARVLERYADNQVLPSALDLAKAWAGQFGTRAPRVLDQRLDEVVAVAADFLCELTQELRRRTDGHPETTQCN